MSGFNIKWDRLRLVSSGYSSVCVATVVCVATAVCAWLQ